MWASSRAVSSSRDMGLGPEADPDDAVRDRVLTAGVRLRVVRHHRILQGHPGPGARGRTLPLPPVPRAELRRACQRRLRDVEGCRIQVHPPPDEPHRGAVQLHASPAPHDGLQHRKHRRHSGPQVRSSIMPKYIFPADFNSGASRQRAVRLPVSPRMTAARSSRSSA